MKKITGKQVVTGSLDINSFVDGADPHTVEPVASPATKTAENKAEAPVIMPVSKPKQLRKKKEPKELVSERVQILVSPAELERIKEKAGLASTSKFLRKYLQDNGLI